MKSSRASPQNSRVQKAARTIGTKEIAYCEKQGDVFMTAVDKDIPISQFAELYMNSQVAGLLDVSFSQANGIDSDELADLIQLPMLLDSPELIVALVMWLNDIINGMGSAETYSEAMLRALSSPAPSVLSPYLSPASADAYLSMADYSSHADIAVDVTNLDIAVDAVHADNVTEDATNQDSVTEDDAHGETTEIPAEKAGTKNEDITALVKKYEYAYWLGYIYRYECLLHEESSRMVFSVLDEPTMKEMYGHLNMQNINLADCAQEICQRLDMLIVNKL